MTPGYATPVDRPCFIRIQVIVVHQLLDGILSGTSLRNNATRNPGEAASMILTNLLTVNDGGDIGISGQRMLHTHLVSLLIGVMILMLI